MGVGLTLSNVFSSNINEIFRRQQAEEVYKKHEQYNKNRQGDLDAFLLKLTEESAEVKTEPKPLGAGQVKQVHLPIGKTLRETIALWRDVRSEALSVPEPTPNDYHLASKASTNIRRAESQIALNQQANTEVSSTVHKERKDRLARLSEPFSTRIEESVAEHKRKFEKAISAYSFQVQMELNGFKMDTPSFLKVA